MYMSSEERRDYHLFLKVILDALTKYKCGTFDCGHTQAYDTPFHLIESEDGQFVAICDECNQKL